MACPGGCAGGGGQPVHDGIELAEERGRSLYGIDSASPVRFSHENPAVQMTYDEYLEKPLSQRAHGAAAYRPYAVEALMMHRLLYPIPG